MSQKEVRLSSFSPENLEIRQDDQKMIIEGYAAVYDDQTRIGNDVCGFNEVIERGAFEGTKMNDVVMRYNHSDGFAILARTRNKSLVLTPDDKGLKVRAELLDTTDGVDMYKRVKAGLIDKMSFAFTVADQEIDQRGKLPLRHIKKFDCIFDVSVVDTPAYESTDVYARSLELAKAWRGKTVDTEKLDSGSIMPNYYARSWAIAYDVRKVENAR